MNRWGNAGTLTVALTLCVSIWSEVALGADNQIRIARQFGLGYLPTMVMEHKGFLKKQALALGLKDVKVSWLRLANAGAMNDALLSGNLDFASGGEIAPIVAWDRTVGSKREIIGVCGESVIPYTLFTNRPNIKSIKDFHAGDRISVVVVKVSPYAIMLEMAAAKAFGQANYAKIDPLTISMPHPTALNALLNGQTAADFTWPPYSYIEAHHPGIHKVLDSTDILGGHPISGSVIWTSKAFHDDHPKLYRAFLNAMKESIAFIKAHKDQAAKIYVGMTHTKQPIQKMLENPQIGFDLAPRGVMRFATFLHTIGTIHHEPKSWKDLYLPEVHDLAGD